MNNGNRKEWGNQQQRHRDYNSYSNKHKLEEGNKEVTVDDVPKESLDVKGRVACKLMNVRERPSLDSKILEVVKLDCQLRILEEDSEFYKIETETGIIGYGVQKLITVE